GPVHYYCRGATHMEVGFSWRALQRAASALVPTLLAALVAAQTPSSETDLREAISLTSHAQFEQAIPHFLAARGKVANSFALEFNLALCYVGTRQFPEAIRILSQLPAGSRPAEVKNLLAQALVGDH